MEQRDVERHLQKKTARLQTQTLLPADAEPQRPPSPQDAPANSWCEPGYWSKQVLAIDSVATREPIGAELVHGADTIDFSLAPVRYFHGAVLNFQFLIWHTRLLCL